MPALRGLPSDDADTRFSKTLAYLLRHGAQKQGLFMRQDGWVKVEDLLSRQEFTDMSMEHLHHLVSTNAKKRFTIMYGSDPTPRSPPPPKGKGKQPPQDPNAEDLPISEITPTPVIAPYDASLPVLPGTTASASSPSSPQWFIRASQGHSLPITTDHMTPVLKDDEAGETGLSPMTRLHVHLSPSLSHPTVRPNSSTLIYLSLSRLLEAGIPVFVSENGVVLTPGDSTGRVRKELFKRVVRRRKEFVDPEPVEKSADALVEEAAAKVGDMAVEEEPKAGDGPVGKQKKTRKGKALQKVKKEWDEVVWEDGAPVDPPRIISADS